MPPSDFRAADTVSITLPFGTSLHGITPTIVFTGASISPASGTAQDFTTSVRYTVTAEDGSTKDYVVTVNVALSSSKEITSFALAGVNAVISDSTITVTLPSGTSLNALSPLIMHTGASIVPEPGMPRDVTSPVSYQVSAANGSFRTYTVTVSIAVGNSKEILTFQVTDAISTTIGTNTVTVIVPEGTNVTMLAPSITTSGVAVSPPSGSFHDFSQPVSYTVQAEDNSTRSYVVTVTFAG